MYTKMKVKNEEKAHGKRCLHSGLDDALTTETRAKSSQAEANRREPGGLLRVVRTSRKGMEKSPGP